MIEVGSGQDKLGLGQDEDEDMSPLPTPPTLSITEEIMQFINESRAREGMPELSSSVVRNELGTMIYLQMTTVISKILVSCKLVI